MSESPRKPVLVSGIQPTGSLTIGNYAGAVRNWFKLREEYECFFILAGLHAITLRQEAEKLSRRCREFAAMLLACGIDPDKDVFFVQSHVPAHTELSWILNSIAQMGELDRMIQFKEKSKRRGKKSVSAALFEYPILMAADILLYGAEIVPVGEDQKQHLELTVNLARRSSRPRFILNGNFQW